LTYFALPDTQRIFLDVVGNGYLHLNTIDLKHFPWQGIYFENNLIDIEALAYPGYIFTGWSDLSLPDTSFISINLTDTFYLTAYFVQDTTQPMPLVINEINYNSATAYNADDWVEIYNPNSFTVNINGWKLMDNNAFNVYEFQPNTFIDADGFLLICRDTALFKLIYPGVDGYIGNISFGFGSTTDLVRLYNFDDVLIDIVGYSSTTPWPYEANGWGPTLELMYPYLDNSVPQSWVSNSGYMGTPGEHNRVLSSDRTISDENELLVRVYPNPFSSFSEMTIRSSEEIDAFEIYTADGRMMEFFPDIQPEEQNGYLYIWNGKDLSGAQLRSGIYILRVKTEKHQKNIRIVKM
jgi:hypothetical protein